MKTLADTYRHGTYAYLGESVLTEPRGGANIPVYFGRLPVHLASKGSGTGTAGGTGTSGGTGTAGGAVNEPVLLRSFGDAARLAGYCEDFTNFDLCEAIAAHFLTDQNPVGPIVVINVFDPETMREPTSATELVTLRGGVGRFTDVMCIPDTVAIEDLEYGLDFEVSYNAETGQHALRDLTGTLVSPVEITYTRADPAAVTAEHLVGTANEEGEYTGIPAVEHVYPRLGVIPSILCAPGWSGDPVVHAALIRRANQINGHWMAYVNADIPVKGVATIGAAIEWKSANGYTNECETPCWPMAKRGEKLYHISTLATVAMMQTDLNNNGLPFETPSNKPVDVSGLFVNETKNVGYSKTHANRLDEAGIRTVLHWGGRWALWGSHTGAFNDGTLRDARAFSDSGMRMLYFIVNQYQTRYNLTIDTPFTRGAIQSLLVDMQGWLDGLVDAGAILFASVAFHETENSSDDLMRGSVKFNIRTTTMPPIRVLTAEVSYTDGGLRLLFGEEAA